MTYKGRKKREERDLKKYIAENRRIARFTLHHPKVLQYAGPILNAEWHVPKALAKAMQAIRRPIPEPVRGQMLIDTGALGTCIGQDAADRLGLLPTRMTETRGVSGAHRNPVYTTRLHIRVSSESGEETFAFDHEVIGVPGLHEYLRGELRDMDGRPVEIIGLLGRDFLRHTLFMYNGPTGDYELHFDIPSMRVDAAL